MFVYMWYMHAPYHPLEWAFSHKDETFLPLLSSEEIMIGETETLLFAVNQQNEKQLSSNKICRMQGQIG